MSKQAQFDSGQLLEMSDYASSDEENDQKETLTQKLYKSMINDRDFILSFQRGKINEDEETESEEEDANKKFLSSSGSIELEEW